MKKIKENLLTLKDLSVYYFTGEGTVRAVEDFSLSLLKGEIMGLVGESGCGKSTVGLSILRLVPPPGKIVKGKIIFDGVDLTSIDEKEMKRIRGKRINMVFQDPMTSLDPLMKIGEHLTETLIVHEKITKEQAQKKAIETLKLVGIRPERFNDYPHQFSGGMRQRVMISLAISLNPDLIIADEPTTALDVIVQAQILDLFKELRKKLGLSLILITHDLSVVLEIADRVAVMYGGWLVEYGRNTEIYDEPLHPYTAQLLKSIPNIELEDQKLKFIPGNPPDLINPPSGCRFWPRCPKKMEKCKLNAPRDIYLEEKRLVKCFLYE